MIYKLPCKLGTHSIKKYKEEIFLDAEGKPLTKFLSVDYVATKLLWKDDPEAKANKIRIYNLNDHTDGYRYRFYWDKKNGSTQVNLKGILGYNFILTRDNKRKMAKVIRKDITDYYIIDKYKHKRKK